MQRRDEAEHHILAMALDRFFPGEREGDESVAAAACRSCLMWPAAKP